jgi:hypothetical protein
MNIDIQENTVIIKDCDSNLDNLLTSLINKKFENQNIILDISNYKTLKPKDLNVFLSFAKDLKKKMQSFVIVITDFDFNKTSEKIIIVPTIQEAFDIIEMEDIERDLG